MRWLRAKEGCLEINHRASPGTVKVPEGTVFESATATCVHCNSIVVLNPDRKRPRGYCRKCDDYICDSCQASDCRPYTQLLDAELEKIYSAIQMGKI